MKMKFVALMAVALLAAACSDETQDGGASMATGNGRMTSGNAVAGSQQDLVVNVGDRVFFTLNESDLKPEARATLDRQAAWLKRYSTVRVTIEGNCDERGTREYNLALGARRATAVKEYLVAAGIDSSRITTVSYGKERPAVLGHDEAAWAQNRRAVTVVTQ